MSQSSSQKNKTTNNNKTTQSSKTSSEKVSNDKTSPKHTSKKVSKSMAWLKVVLIAEGVVLAIGITAFVFFYMVNKKETPDSEILEEAEKSSNAEKGEEKQSNYHTESKGYSDEYSGSIVNPLEHAFADEKTKKEMDDGEASLNKKKLDEKEKD